MHTLGYVAQVADCARTSYMAASQVIEALDAPIQESMAIDCLTADQYHRIFWWDLSCGRRLWVSTPVTVNLGAIIVGSSPHYSTNHAESLGLDPTIISWCSCDDDDLEDTIEIASLPYVESEPEIDVWEWRTYRGKAGGLTGDSWTHYNSDDVFDKTFNLMLSDMNYQSWPSQANHIFSRLQTTSNFEDYMHVTGIIFTIDIGYPNTPEEVPEGFLFLCPPIDFQMGPSSFRWPDCPAYWSLDPVGVKRLSMEDATHLGFPSIDFSATAWGKYWDASAYTGLRQFYQAKGFDPDSQDIARHLGYPVYQLSPGVGVPLAHASGADSHAEEKDQHSLIVDGDSEET
ncbi:hypothetical protein C8J57DRAFT_1483763, partial [Mycena rebaudengoi]